MIIIWEIQRLKKDNQIEFLLNCEHEMELIGNNISDKEKIDFIIKHLQDSAARWYMIVDEKSTTYKQFKDSFESW